MQRRENFRTCLWYATPRDAAAFHNALLAIHPRILWTKPDRHTSPSMTLHEEPLKLVSDLGQKTVQILFAETDWEPQFVRFEDDRFSNEFRVVNFPHWSILWTLGYWDWGGLYDGRRWICDFPTLQFGQLTMLYDRHDPAERRFVNAVWRQLRACMVQMEKGSMDWVGHDACKWVLEGGPRRMIGGAWRPPADYVFPADSPYYKGTEQIPRGDVAEPVK